MSTSISYGNGGKEFYIVPDNMEKKISKYYVGSDNRVYLCPECLLNIDFVSGGFTQHACSNKDSVFDIGTKTVGDFVKAWTMYTATATNCSHLTWNVKLVNVSDVDKFNVGSYYKVYGETKLCHQCQILEAANLYELENKYDDDNQTLIHQCESSWKADNLNDIIEACNKVEDHTDIIGSLCRYGFVGKEGTT